MTSQLFELSTPAALPKGERPGLIFDLTTCRLALAGFASYTYHARAASKAGLDNLVADYPAGTASTPSRGSRPASIAHADALFESTNRPSRTASETPPKT